MYKRLANLGRTALAFSQVNQKNLPTVSLKEPAKQTVGEAEPYGHSCPSGQTSHCTAAEPLA